MIEHGENGSHGRYAKGCRCNGCRDAHRKYEVEAKRRRSRVRQGIDFYEERWTDAKPAEEHLLFLRSKGISTRSVARRINMNWGNIAGIAAGKRKYIDARTADKILSVAAINLEPFATMDSAKTKKLVNEMASEGLKIKDIAIAIGIPSGKLNLGPRVRVGRHQAIAKLHSEVCKKGQK